MSGRRPGRGQGLRVRDVTRARLLATAEEMFFAAGFNGTTVDAIAHHAGFTTGAVYSNFGGKADLFLAVLEQVSAVEVTAVREALDAARTDEERLSIFTATIVRQPARWQARVAATIEFLSFARGDSALLARIRAAQQVADEAAAELVSALCRAVGIDAPSAGWEMAQNILALMNGFAIRSLFDPELDVGPTVARGVNALLAGGRSDLGAAGPVAGRRVR